TGSFRLRSTSSNLLRAQKSCASLRYSGASSRRRRNVGWGWAKISWSHGSRRTGASVSVTPPILVGRATPFYTHENDIAGRRATDRAPAHARFARELGLGRRSCRCTDRHGSGAEVVG